MSMPVRLTRLGKLERPDHYHIPAGAICYFWGEYTPYEHTNGQKWNFSPTNQLIGNFKKKMDRRGQPGWQYKAQAVAEIATAFSKFWKWDELAQQHRLALVPMPPSRRRDDSLYDSRMLEVVQGIRDRTGVPLDIRDCLSSDGRFEASHETSSRPSPTDLYESLTFDSSTSPEHPPGVIFLFDDVLTTGAHFMAASARLNEHFPDVPIVGNFVARRVLPNPFDDIDPLEPY